MNDTRASLEVLRQNTHMQIYFQTSHVFYKKKLKLVQASSKKTKKLDWSIGKAQHVG